MGEVHREEFHRGAKDARVLGEDKFLQRVLNKHDRAPSRRGLSLNQAINRVCRQYRVRPSDLGGPSRGRRLAEARGVIAWFAVETGSATLKDVAERMHRDPSAMSYALRRVAEKGRQSRAFQARLRQLTIVNFSINSII